MFSKQPEDKRQRKSQTSPKVLTRELVVCVYFIVNLHTVFYSTPFWGRVYKWKICLSICLSVITSYSDSKLTQHHPVNLNHATSLTVFNFPHPCLPCPPVNWSPFPVKWSPNEQDYITDLSFPLGVELCVNLTFFGLYFHPPLAPSPVIVIIKIMIMIISSKS